MFLLNVKVLPERLLCSAFTIQNVPIKFNTNTEGLGIDLFTIQNVPIKS